MTMTLISTVTVGSGGAASIDLASIPQTFTDLCIVYSLRSAITGTAADNIKIQFNNSTTGYTYRLLYGTGGGTGSYSQAGSGTPTDGIAAYASSSDNTSNTFGSISVYIPNYSGSTYKSVSLDAVTETNGSTAFQNITAGLWSNTSAITSVKVLSNTGQNMVQYSTASIYGVLKGSGGATVS